ncbi:uncharacterized protein LOC110019258 isoform X2 [Phalaenopsis equestris]|nr:uncharacterized protein LOC110019258 isoform X2 [Phalaenopsis equestris]XP_020572526.1 uncharacterized protein LOC110019258 isoform X2 [Phalaenopsis equestris]
MVYFSHHNSGNATSEVKSAADTETDGLSDSESPPKAFSSSQWRKPCVSEGSNNFKFIASDETTPGNLSPEGKDPIKSSGFPTASYNNSSAAIPSSSPLAIKVDDPSSSMSRFIPSDPTSSRKARRSPGYQLCRQISYSRIPSLKSLNEGSSPEVGRHSFVLSNELSAGESHGGSSDGWSMRTFSELVASSQRDRWSFESENLTSFTNKIFSPSFLPKSACSSDLQTCFICSKILKEKSPWSTHKIVSTNDLPIVSVLVCSHVYHAECLESSTSEIEMYDPPCPVCANNGERPELKQFGKFEQKGRNKISRIAVADADPDAPRHSISMGRRSGKRPIMGASSSGKGSSSKQFLKRHFSIGSRPVRSASESETTRKKGFWARYQRD